MEVNFLLDDVSVVELLYNFYWFLDVIYRIDIFWKVFVLFKWVKYIMG